VVRPGFEWFVAWRHLRDPERQTRRTLIVGLVVLCAGLAFLGAAAIDGSRYAPDGLLVGRRSWLAENLKLTGVIVTIAGAIVTYLGILFAQFTVFTAISIFGVFLGTGAPVIALSVMSGFEADLKSKIRGTKADVVITVPGDQPFSDWQSVRRKVVALPGVVASTPYLEGEVMLRSASNPAGVILKGIDPTTAADTLALGRTMREGKLEYLAHPERIPSEPRTFRFPDALSPRPADEGRGGGDGSGSAEMDADLPAIIVGEDLYLRTLHVLVGSTIDVACPLCGVGPTGPEPRMKRFRVAGHFYSGMYEFDSKLAYVSLAEAQKFLRLPGEVTGIEVRTATPESARAVAAAITRALGAGYEARSWEELNQELFRALRLEKIAMFVVLAFIALVASFSIISNLIMLVTEKGREVAILKSMGAGDGAILRIFVAEGLYIGILGLVVGIAAGIAGCVLMSRYGLPLDPDVYYIHKLPVVMRAGEIAAVALLALGLCCAATLYPALLASRLRPVAGLRYE